MLGYCGGVLGLYVVRPLVLEGGYRAAFIPSGLLFLFFALPCMLFVKDRKPLEGLRLSSILNRHNVLYSFRKFIEQNFSLIRISGMADFLKAIFFCLCVVNVIILFMSVYATRVFGLSEPQIIDLVLFSTIFAIIGSLLSGRYAKLS